MTGSLVGLGLWLSKASINEFVEKKCDEKIEREAKTHQEAVQSYCDYAFFEKANKSRDIILTGGHHEEMITELEGILKETELNQTKLPAAEVQKAENLGSISQLSMFNKSVKIGKEEEITKEYDSHFAFSA